MRFDQARWRKKGKNEFDIGREITGKTPPENKKHPLKL